MSSKREEAEQVLVDLHDMPECHIDFLLGFMRHLESAGGLSDQISALRELGRRATSMGMDAMNRCIEFKIKRLEDKCSESN